MVIELEVTGKPPKSLSQLFWSKTAFLPMREPLQHSKMALKTSFSLKTLSILCRTYLLLTVIELEVTGKPPKSLSQLLCSKTAFLLM
jgi:hypothetical protein